MRFTIKATDYILQVVASEEDETDVVYFTKFAHFENTEKAEAYLKPIVDKMNETTLEEQSALLSDAIDEIEYAKRFELTQEISIPMP